MKLLLIVIGVCGFSILVCILALLCANAEKPSKEVPGCPKKAGTLHIKKSGDMLAEGWVKIDIDLFEISRQKEVTFKVEVEEVD